MPKENEERAYRAIHAPLSEFFDAYVLVGYTAGRHDRLVMVNASDKMAIDALQPVRAVAAEWIGDTEDV